MNATQDKLRTLMAQTNQALAGSLAMPCSVTRIFMSAEGRLLNVIFDIEGIDDEFRALCPTPFASVQGVSQAVYLCFIQYADSFVSTEEEVEGPEFDAWALADTEDHDETTGAPEGATLQ